MVHQIKKLVQIQLTNFWKINEIRFGKDRQKKKRIYYLMLLRVFLGIMFIFYVSLFSYTYIQMGMADVVPMILAATTSLLILFFGIVSSGNVIFQKNSYEVLCSLPVSKPAIVISRFFSMYFDNLLITLVVMGTGTIVYGISLGLGIGFYLTGLAGIIFLPLLPMAVATLLGAAVTAIASRMKYKGPVTAVLSILFASVIIIFSMQSNNMENVTAEMLQNLSQVMIEQINHIYPPAIWLGAAMTSSNIFLLLTFIILSLSVFLIMAVVVSIYFQKICNTLYSTTAKNNYRIRRLKTSSTLKALYFRELRRYFSSGIYISNTVMGAVLMALASVAILVMGMDKVEALIPVPGMVRKAIPFVIGAMPALMPTTSVSISMEGKEWWIIKSLPVKAKTVFDSKMLVNLSVIAPFYILAEILLMVAIRPSLLEAVWLMLVPLTLIIFTTVFGIFSNLMFPVFDWENEAAVVKQSTTSMISVFISMAIVIACALPVFLISSVPTDLILAFVCMIMLFISFVLYRRNNRTDLKSIG